MSRMPMDISANRVLSSFLEGISQAFEISSGQATFFVSQGADTLKTIMILGGKDPAKVVKMFKILGENLSTSIYCSRKDKTERDTLENIIATLSFAFVSKLPEIAAACSLYFGILFNELSAVEDQTWSRMVTSKLLLLDSCLLKNVKNAVESDPDRGDQIFQFLASQETIDMLALDLNSVDSLNASDRFNIFKFYLQCCLNSSSQLIARLLAPLRKKLTEPEQDVNFIAHLCVFFVEIEVSLLNIPPYNYLGVTETEAAKICNKVVGLLKDKSTGMILSCKALVLCLAILNRSAEASKSGNNPSLIFNAIDGQRDKIIDSSLTTNHACLNHQLLSNTSQRTCNINFVEDILTGIKKYLTHSKSKMLEKFDTVLLSFYATCIGRLEEFSAPVRLTLFDQLIEGMGHQFAYRECLQMLHAFIGSVDRVDINKEHLLKAARSISKDIQQVKYRSLGHQQDSPTLSYSTKLFKVSLQLSLVLKILQRTPSVDLESKRVLLAIYKKVEEVCAGMSFHGNVCQILNFLDPKWMDSPRKEKKKSYEGIMNKSPPARYSSNQTNTNRGMKEIADNSSRGKSKSPPPNKIPMSTENQQRLTFNKEPPRAQTPYNAEKTNKEEWSLPQSKLLEQRRHSQGPIMKRANPLPKFTMNPENLRTIQGTGMNTSISAIEHVTDRVPSALSVRKRVQTTLMLSQAPLMKPETNLQGDKSLVRQVPVWSELPLVEKSQLIVLHKEALKHERDNGGARFIPEINPDKEARILVPLGTGVQLVSTAPLAFPYNPDLEDEQTLKAVKILFGNNKPFLLRLFKHLQAYSHAKNPNALLPLAPLVHFMKMINLQHLVSSEECKSFVQRIKLTQKEVKDALAIGLEEFKLFLCHAADLLSRKCPDFAGEMVIALESLLKRSKLVFHQCVPNNQYHDQEVLSYLEENRPETLPQVGLCY